MPDKLLSEVDSLFLQSIPLGTGAEKAGIFLVSANAQETIGRMPVVGNTQPYGMLHGGCSALLAETVASVAGNLWASQCDSVAVGTQITLTHLASAREGEVTCTAQALHLGTRTATYRVEIRRDDSTLLSAGQVSCQIIKQ